MNRVYDKVKFTYELILILLAVWVCYSTLDTRHMILILSVMWILEDHVERVITRWICRVYRLGRKGK